MTAQPAIAWDKVADDQELLAPLTERGARWVRVHAHAVVVLALVAWQDDGQVSEDELQDLARACASARIALALAADDSGLSFQQLLGALHEHAAARPGRPCATVGADDDDVRLARVFESIAEVDAHLFDALSRVDDWRPGPEFERHLGRLALVDAILLLLATGHRLWPRDTWREGRQSLIAAAEATVRDIRQTITDAFDRVFLPAVGVAHGTPVADPPATGLPPYALLVAARGLLDGGHHDAAREAAAYGRALHPAVADFSALERVLAPPEVLGSSQALPQSARFAAAFAARPAAGEGSAPVWVRVRNGRRIGTWRSYAEAAADASEDDVVVKVPAHGG